MIAAIKTKLAMVDIELVSLDARLGAARAFSLNTAMKVESTLLEAQLGALVDLKRKYNKMILEVGED